MAYIRGRESNIRKKYYLSVIIALFIVFLTLGTPHSSFAEDTSTDSNSLNSAYLAAYDQGINAGIINPNSLSYAEWVNENNNSYRPVFLEGIKDGVVPKSMSYQEWIAENNYGQDPTISSSTDSSNSLVHPDSNDPGPGGGGYIMKAGDVFVTNSTSSSGILGHAAIAASDAHILDVPGTGDRPKNDNNRMSTLSKWVHQYAVNGRWIHVYRMNGHPNLSYDAGHYGYTHFYSTTANLNNKNIHLTYGITPHINTLNPMYCSKLVYQAYYKGTGTYRVLVSFSGFLSPYELPSLWESNYKLTLIKTYD